MATRASGVLEKGLFRQDVLNQDVAGLRALARAQGFADATVGPAEVRFEDGRTRAHIVIPVVEGPRVTVGHVGVEGQTLFTTVELLAAIPIVPGDPWNPARIEEGRGIEYLPGTSRRDGRRRRHSPRPRGLGRLSHCRGLPDANRADPPARARGDEGGNGAPAARVRARGRLRPGAACRGPATPRTPAGVRDGRRGPALRPRRSPTSGPSRQRSWRFNWAWATIPPWASAGISVFARPLGGPLEAPASASEAVGGEAISVSPPRPLYRALDSGT
jgi:hypothetical protein